MSEYDFNRIMAGTAADSFRWERFFRELGLVDLVRKALGIKPRHVKIQQFNPPDPTLSKRASARPTRPQTKCAL
jgi:hypothetical protein